MEQERSVIITDTICSGPFAVECMCNHILDTNDMDDNSIVKCWCLLSKKRDFDGRQEHECMQVTYNKVLENNFKTVISKADFAYVSYNEINGLGRHYTCVGITGISQKIEENPRKKFTIIVYIGSYNLVTYDEKGKSVVTGDGSRVIDYISKIASLTPTSEIVAIDNNVYEKHHKLFFSHLTSAVPTLKKYGYFDLKKFCDCAMHYNDVIDNGTRRCSPSPHKSAMLKMLLLE